eukprot:TRINITY_DN1814_c0_g1_i1.p1 TRINITY_DN1814_c0_g1~~TRINITY_DN1814_c0_g1_i1.p1  ORF type:complete len:268 (-),score=67.91 TRINITY_DN1814_c0_g1_i1:73-876(-)
MKNEKNNDYRLAGEIVIGYKSIGEVARAMILEGMKEHTKNTFGEESLILFAGMDEDEDDTSSSTRSSIRGPKLKVETLKWDSSKKGDQISVSPDGKSIASGRTYVSWNCILSENVFSEGVHYVEIYVDHVPNGYLFFGIGDPSNVPLGGCISGSNSCLVVGYDARFTQLSHVGVVQHDTANQIGRFTNSQYVGLLIDQEKKELSIVIDNKPPILIYSNIPKDQRIFCCIAHNVVLTFTKHIVGKAVQNYLKNPQTNYTPSEWVNSKK